MSQPPYPPQGGDDPGGERSGPHDRDLVVGADDPTRQFDHPSSEGQRNATQQFGQPQYGPSAQPPYGEPQYWPPPGQPSYPQYGQPPYPEYSEPQYGPPQYGQPQYGPQYGPAPYGQPPHAPYGHAAYGQPWGPPGGQPPKKNRTMVIALVVGAVLFVAAIGAGLFFLLRAGDGTPATAASSESSSTDAGPSAPVPAGESGIPAATVTPDGLGNDPDLDELAQECYQGDMGSCDDLYEQAELDSLYALYGGTCAGRQNVVDADTVFCTTAFPED